MKVSDNCTNQHDFVGHKQSLFRQTMRSQQRVRLYPHRLNVCALLFCHLLLSILFSTW